ncbi:MAG: hypothetical protein LQ338_007991 [Usnochroma carphineum]|nr:MAG: hypothetical protein LQ338_007991 [Usnochroma carphineum]
MSEIASAGSLQKFLRCSLLILVLDVLLHVSNAHPINNPNSSDHSYLSKRKSNLGGIHILPGTCHGPDFIKVQNAIADASYLAGAALNAASDFAAPPFSYFFKNDTETATTVAGVYARVQDAQKGKGDPIGVTCSDIYNACRSPKGGRHLAYTAEYPGSGLTPLIIFCPSGLRIPRLPIPCSLDPGTRPITLGSVLLHEMTHVRWISGPALKVVDTSSGSPRQINDDLKAGKKTTRHANAYSFLGTWSWDLGLGGPPWNQQRTCLSDFANGHFDANIGA